MTAQTIFAAKLCIGHSNIQRGIKHRVPARLGHHAALPARPGFILGWLGYTLTWFWASEEGILGGDARFSGRHLLSAGLTTRISQGTGIRIQMGYGDGLPYTSIPVSSPAVPSYDSGSPGGLQNRFELDSDYILNQAPNLSVGPELGFLRVEA